MSILLPRDLPVEDGFDDDDNQGLRPTSCWRILSDTITSHRYHPSVDVVTMVTITNNNQWARDH